jgi:PKD repeat protein
MWENRDLPLDFASAPYEHVNGCAQTTVEDGRDVVYVAARRGGTPNVLFRWSVAADPDEDTFARVGGYWVAAGGQTTCGYWPQRKLFVYTSSGSNPIVFWDLTTPGATNYNKHVHVAGLQPLIEGLAAKSMSIVNCALKFDPARANFVLWCGDATLWRITPPATNATTGWSVQQVEGGGTPPVRIIGTGLLGKWKYAPQFDVFVGLMDPVDGSVWVYKPVGWVDPGGGQPLPNRPPTAAPTYAPVPARVGQPVTLNANASDVDGSVVNVDWLFGDGATATGATVVRTFTAAGAYSAQLTVTDDDGTAGSGSVLVDVVANQPPTLTVSASTTSALTGETIAFTADAADSDGAIASVAWTFGDGGTAQQATASHAYASAGTFVATAHATDDEGATTSATVTVTVRAAGGTGDVTVQLVQGAGGYSGTSDTYLDRYTPGVARGGSTVLNVSASYFAPLLRFAIFQSEGGPVPDGATIVTAELALYKRSTYNQTYRLHRLLMPWMASQATWNQRLAGVPWGTPGALGAGTDIDATPDGQVQVGWDPAIVRFDVTTRVQAWSDEAASGTPANHGWRLSWAGGNTNRAYFDSSERTSGTPAVQRPMLVVSYRTGEPQ